MKIMGRHGLYRASDWNRESKAVKSGAEPERYRHDARRDFARLVHSPAFRRLQGKTQLFPSDESDFFRNRLTHSLEVAQIAKSIAIRLNATELLFKATKDKINLDLVEFAGLAHDVGHPPFGHNGEAALDKLMLDYGGFEGNAQTLRILTKLEKKNTRGFPSTTNAVTPINLIAQTDNRIGLNLSYRTLASVLKYDNIIPKTEDNRKNNGVEKRPVKGYYYLEEDIVRNIKNNIGFSGDKKLKTIECSIMDVADDIAYSTYDIEDSFKAGFLTPVQMISLPDDFKDRIAEKVHKSISSQYNDKNSEEKIFNKDSVNEVLINLFGTIFMPDENILKRVKSGPLAVEEASFLLSASATGQSQALIQDGYLRAAFTSDLVGKFVTGVELIANDENPMVSKVRLTLENFRIVETLKHFSYQLLIESPRLKIAERRGNEIIGKIFENLVSDSQILPDDWRKIHSAIDDTAWKKRVVCDYIAGMTDRYCVELYSRITGSSPISFWKPH